MSPDASITLAQGRERYFRDNEIRADGGYDDAWVHIQLGPIRLGFPNTQGRKRGVRLHDLNHVVTGYRTDLTGEAEIGAWELASGCTRFPIVVLLNLLVIWPILFVTPSRVWRAFVRGRHSENLYGETSGETLDARPVELTQGELGLDDTDVPATLVDRLSFLGLLAVVVGLQALIVGVFLILPFLGLRELIG